MDAPRTVAEYPGAQWLPAHPSRVRVGTPGRKVTLIVDHITSGHPEALGTAQMFARAPVPPEEPSSAHFVIGQAGEVIQCVALDDIAKHAHDCNGHSIGIEHSAREPGEFGHNDAGLPLSPAQIEASVALHLWLCARLQLPRDAAAIQGHAAADPKTTHKGCPTAVAGGWPWERWIGAPPVCI